MLSCIEPCKMIVHQLLERGQSLNLRRWPKEWPVSPAHWVDRQEDCSKLRPHVCSKLRHKQQLPELPGWRLRNVGHNKAAFCPRQTWHSDSTNLHVSPNETTRQTLTQSSCYITDLTHITMTMTHIHRTVSNQHYDLEDFCSNFIRILHMDLLQMQSSSYQEKIDLHYIF